MSNKTYVGVAPLTMIRTNAGGYLNVYAGGVVPEDIAGDDLERLIDEGYLAEAEVVEPVDAFDPEKGGNVKDSVAWVGSDKERAQQLLDLEQAKDEPRPSLVEKLQTVLAAE